MAHVVFQEDVSKVLTDELIRQLQLPEWYDEYHLYLHLLCYFEELIFQVLHLHLLRQPHSTLTFNRVTKSDVTQ